MNRLRLTRWALFIMIVIASCKKDKTEPEPVTPVTPPPASEPVSYMNLAKETHNFILGNFLTSHGSYRANTTNHSQNAYEWYITSQIYADAAMIGAGDASYLPYMNKTFKWMENMWDKNSNIGGYFAAANLDGTGAAGDKYIDDNALTGMVYLEAYDVTTGADKEAYLAKARACANWLMNAGVWDNTYGGGFWWNTTKPEKPTQSNGLALQLFLRLYKITGESYYRDWAISVNNWLSTRMFDTNRGLFIWKIDGAGNGVKHNELFTYDNAIMVEAYIIYSQVMNDPSYLQRAQALGAAMNTVLWNASRKQYIFNTTDNRVNPAWCAWGSQAMIRLYEADNNQTWLNYAKQNIDGLNVSNRNSTTKAYHFFARMDGSDRSPEIEGVDQAWMQRVQALYSKYSTSK
ncbi:glycoside hydrolase family 76 protein [Desertivirga brevis]|uniref:glycoside hydrolase family 76 protein n=1 Tax=Desertivirga brevis TaxID=2810310 RepID=UPI001A97612B|nr:glycoside hydrolase family 76 protein [Pedobacter sp. SYSU D00873]